MHFRFILSLQAKRSESEKLGEEITFADSDSEFEIEPEEVESLRRRLRDLSKDTEDEDSACKSRRSARGNSLLVETDNEGDDVDVSLLEDGALRWKVSRFFPVLLDGWSTCVSFSLFSLLE